MSSCHVKCGYCGKYVKDKFIFGFLHFCLAKKEIREIEDFRRKAYIQRSFVPLSRFKDLGKLR